MAAASPSGSEPDPAKLAVLKDALYDHLVASGDETHYFDQDEIVAMGVVEDPTTLSKLIQSLMKDRLLVSATRQGGGYVWRWRSIADAEKYKALNREQSMVYEIIDDAGADGIWSRTIKARSKMHESVLSAQFKFLISKGYIREMKSVQHPNKKMYIKASLRPSELATGGPWYSDSDLDEAFISHLQKAIFVLITQKSTYESRHGGGIREKQPKKGILKGERDPKTGKKRGADEISAGDEPKTKAVVREPKRTVLLPLPAGYNDYPTTRELAEMIANNDLTNNITLSVADVQQLVDVLVYDGLIEPVQVGKRKGYRTVRAARVDPIPLTAFMRDPMHEDMMEMDALDMGPGLMSNGLTEAPCGRCPVFDLCEEGGPVNPSTCTYFQRWLGDE